MTGRCWSRGLECRSPPNAHLSCSEKFSSDGAGDPSGDGAGSVSESSDPLCVHGFVYACSRTCARVSALVRVSSDSLMIGERACVCAFARARVFARARAGERVSESETSNPCSRKCSPLCTTSSSEIWGDTDERCVCGVCAGGDSWGEHYNFTTLTALDSYHFTSATSETLHPGRQLRRGKGLHPVVSGRALALSTTTKSGGKFIIINLY